MVNTTMCFVCNTDSWYKREKDLCHLERKNAVRKIMYFHILKQCTVYPEYTLMFWCFCLVDVVFLYAMLIILSSPETWTFQFKTIFTAKTFPPSVQSVERNHLNLWGIHQYSLCSLTVCNASVSGRRRYKVSLTLTTAAHLHIRICKPATSTTVDKGSERTEPSIKDDLLEAHRGWALGNIAVQLVSIATALGSRVDSNFWGLNATGWPGAGVLLVEQVVQKSKSF